MDKEARTILEVFRSRNCQPDDLIQFWDFGEAILWEEGYVRDEETRNGLRFLIENQYVVEYLAGLGLTRKGYEWLSGAQVMLDPDVAEVFTSSEAVNRVLRALIQTMPPANNKDGK